MSSVPQDSFLSELDRAKRALEDGLYAPEDYAVVSRACAAAQSLQIGIRAGIIVCNYELQAAFFAALGLPGTPSDTGIPVAIPHVHQPGQMPRFEDLGAGQNQPRGPRQRRGGAGGGGRPQDGLERDHRP